MESEQELPEGWERVTLQDVCQKVPNVKPEDEPEREFGYVDISSICNTTFTIGETKRFLGKDAPSRARRPIQPDDVLFSTVRTYLRNIARIPENLAAELCSTGFTVLRPNGAVIPQYLFYYTLSDDFIDAVTPQQTGSQYPATSDRVVFSTPIPLPPLAEQRRIVARLKALLADIGRVRGRLDAVAATMQRFRQAVLAAAVGGQLSREWRNAHEDITGEKKCTENSLGVEANPDTWSWSTLPKMGFMGRGRSRNRPRNAPHLYNGPYPFIQTGDIAQANGMIVDHKQTYNEEGLAQSKIWPEGTLCITIAANIANSAILTYPACFPDSVVGFIPDEKVCVAKFVEYYIRTIRGDIANLAPATAQKNINNEILKVIPIHLPPLEEQHEIVRRVEALFALADRIEGEVAGALERVEALREAVLAKAFRGELVPTEAEVARREGRAYEPAGVLLERVRARREASAVTQKPRRRRKGAITVTLEAFGTATGTDSPEPDEEKPHRQAL